MSRIALTLRSPNDKEAAARLVAAAPYGSRVEIKQARRSDEQNDRMWALLRAIREQLVWHGNQYSEEHWKQFLLHQLNGEMYMPGESGGMVPLIARTSDLGVREMSDFMALIEAFCARQGVSLEADRKPDSRKAKG